MGTGRRRVDYLLSPEIWRMRLQLLRLLLMEWRSGLGAPRLHEYVNTASPETARQILGGFDFLDCWTSQSVVVLLKKPRVARKLIADIHVSEDAAARRVTLLLDGREVISQPVDPHHNYIVESLEAVRGSVAELRVDRTFRPPGDQRDLGVVLLGIGFMPASKG
jgi:hypothetical protein